MLSYPRAFTIQLARVEATPTIATSAAACATSGGWCTSMPSPGAGRADSRALAALDAVIQRIPDGAVVLIDGLIASTAPEVLVPRRGA